MTCTITDFSEPIRLKYKLNWVRLELSCVYSRHRCLPGGPLEQRRPLLSRHRHKILSDKFISQTSTAIQCKPLQRRRRWCRSWKCSRVFFSQQNISLNLFLGVGSDWLVSQAGLLLCFQMCKIVTSITQCTQTGTQNRLNSCEELPAVWRRRLEWILQSEG